jgi:hypothetical protein
MKKSVKPIENCITDGLLQIKRTEEILKWFSWRIEVFVWEGQAFDQPRSKASK